MIQIDHFKCGNFKKINKKFLQIYNETSKVNKICPISTYLAFESTFFRREINVDELENVRNWSSPIL
jgi:hypothetical protein